MTAFNPNSNQLRDRRKYHRKTPRSTVRVEYRQSPFGLKKSLAVQFLNISVGGLCIVVPEALASKEALEVSILGASQSKPITCLAKVCWSVPLDNGTFCVGLEFRKRLLFEEVLRIARPSVGTSK
jgi:PilZ domain